MLSFLIELSETIGFTYNNVHNTENCLCIQTGLCCIQAGGPMLRRFQIGADAKNKNLYFYFSGIFWRFWRFVFSFLSTHNTVSSKNFQLSTDIVSKLSEPLDPGLTISLKVGQAAICNF